jgi:YHS domain-containing protein
VRGTRTLKSTAETAGLFRDVEGERYYFCCRRCQDLFDAERLASSPAA